MTKRCGSHRKVRRMAPWCTPTSKRSAEAACRAAGPAHQAICISRSSYAWTCPHARNVEIGFIAALAVADAIETMLPRQERATLKWPNDVLVRNGKISGILVEQADDALILGIGVNVLEAPGGVSYNVSTIVGSGGLATVDGTRAALLTALANWLDVWQRDGFAPIRSAWLARAHPPGTPLRVTIGDRTIEGRFADVRDDGALMIDTDEGRRICTAGDVGFA